MRSVETEGGTIDEAIARALELLHIERERVEVEILENATRGVLGFGGKPARIRATVRSPLSGVTPTTEAPWAGVSRETREAPAPGEAPAPVDPAVVAKSVETARRALEVMLRELGVVAPAAAVPVEDGS